jgi:hypothetical protein
LDPRSLLEDSEAPRFVWHDNARFKHLAGETNLQRFAIESFGSALGRYLVSATEARPPIDHGVSAAGLRGVILKEQPFVRLLDLLSACWSVNIPVIHLRIFPCLQKRMSAMSVRVGERSAIMLAKDSMYPPHVAFYLAHELAHVSLGHLSKEPIVVDLDLSTLAAQDEDPEEIAADRFALELLTGEAEPKVLPAARRYNSSQLARAALEAAPTLKIEPGTLALCFGYSTGDWATANSAIQQIYPDPKPVWAEVNKVAASQLDFRLIPDDAQSYVRAVMGEVREA